MQTSQIFSAQQPIVYYTPVVYQQLWWLVAQSVKLRKEVGFFGTVIKEDHVYTVDQLFIPEQEVLPTETDIDEETFGKVAFEVDKAYDAGHSIHESDKLRYWGHVHPKMGVNPSGQDNKQMLEYSHCDWFIRGIYNEKRETRVDLYDYNINIAYTHLENGLYVEPLTVQQLADLKATYKANVNTASVVVHHGYRGRSNNYLASSDIPAPSKSPHLMTDEEWEAYQKKVRAAYAKRNNEFYQQQQQGIGL